MLLRTLSLVALTFAVAVALGQWGAHAGQGVRPPDLTGSNWLNTEGARPTTLAARKGKVTVVHFWTFACSNCRANLPSYARLSAKYKDQDVEFVGVHTPELGFERVDANVKAAVEKLGIKYPVLIDTNGRNWLGWKLEYWPTVFVVGKSGTIEFKWVGELGYQGAGGENELDAAIRAALDRKGN